jgi:hypothetical protein
MFIVYLWLGVKVHSALNLPDDPMALIDTREARSWLAERDHPSQGRNGERKAIIAAYTLREMNSSLDLLLYTQAALNI